MEHEGRYEKRDADVRMVIGGGILTIVILLAAIGAMYWHFGVEYGAQPKSDSPFAEVRAVPPAPRLQPTPYDDLKRYHERAEAELSKYGWVDKESGVVRIPVDRAVEKLIKQGGDQPGAGAPLAKPEAAQPAAAAKE